MKKKKDPRLDKALKVGEHSFGNDIGPIEVRGVLGFGGSSITYDVSLKESPAKHFALKEYLPYNFINYVKRDKADTIFINKTYLKDWQKGLRIFLNENTIQTKLPDSNSTEGKYFLYAIKSFSFNNTAYILYETEDCKTLKDYLSNKSLAGRDKVKILLECLSDACLGLASLHKQGVLHLDISDTNLMVSSSTTKLTDFGSAILMEKEKDTYALPQNIKTDHLFTYTPGFSPIEIRSAAEDPSELKINEACDTYSICAILYKYIFGRDYDPVDNSVQDLYKKINRLTYHVIPTLPKLSESVTIKLIYLLKKGLSGNEFRYQSALALYLQIKEILDIINEEEFAAKAFKRNCANLVLIIPITIVAILLSGILVWVSNPRPEISAEINSVYSEGETINIEFSICDRDIDKKETLSLKTLENITLSGFTYESVHFVQLSNDKEDAMKYRLSLQNISAENNGEKTISIGKIYQSPVILGKYNKPLKLEFYYGENISCNISAPSVTKVTSNMGHSVEYILQFYSPVDFEINLDNVQVYGFSSEKTVLSDLGNDMFSLTFENIVGESGSNKYFALYDSTAKDDTIYHSKKIISPSFEIIEDGISNSRISVDYSVLENNFKNGGYLILSPEVECAEYYSCNLSKYNLTLNGFEADFYLSERENIILYNIKMEQNTNEYSVLIDEGCFVAENGSRNAVITCNINDINEPDTVKPSVRSICQVDGNSEFVLYELYIYDGGKSVSFNGNPTDYIDLIGFDADIRTTTSGTVCYVTLTDVKPLIDSEELYMKIKEGFAIDESGNKSNQINVMPFVIN